MFKKAFYLMIIGLRKDCGWVFKLTFWKEVICSKWKWSCSSDNLRRLYAAFCIYFRRSG